MSSTSSKATARKRVDVLRVGRHQFPMSADDRAKVETLAEQWLERQGIYHGFVHWILSHV